MPPASRRRLACCAPLVALAVTAAGGACAAAAPAPGVGDAAWRLDPVWDDGLAEVCSYRVAWPRYGETFPGSALLVLVKEPWAPELAVKADEPRADGFEVLKLNHGRDVRTGIYEYHQMASVFLRRDDGRLVKMATTSSEACGITTAELVDGRLTTHSYFDGQGERRSAWPGGLPEDGLPALLRELVVGEVPREIEVFPSLLTPRLPALEPDRWRLVRRRTQAPATEGDGGPVAAVEIVLSRDEDWRRYVFADELPHRMLEHSSSDGTRYHLDRCERLAYWQLNRPGDEEWLPTERR